MFTNKQILKIIFPLLIEQFLTMFVGLADTAMVSSVGEAAVSGVSLVDQINMLLTATLSAFAAGGAVLCSQNLGKGDTLQANRYAKQLLIANAVLSLMITAALVIFNHGILNAFYGSVEPAVMDNARKYFYITALSMPFFAVYNSLAATFRAEGNSRVSMNVSLLMNVMNIVGNAIGIFVFRAGVYGVAVPTLLSRIIGAAVMCYSMAHSHGRIQLCFTEGYKPDFKMIREIYGLGIPMGIENGLFHFGKVILASLVSTLGTSAVAAYAISNKIVNFAYLPGSAISLGVPAIVGQCIGARAFKQAKGYALRLIGYQYSMMLPMITIISIFAPQLTSLFNLSPEAAGYCVDLVRFNNVMMLIHPFAFMIVHVLRAASDVRFPMAISIASMWIFRIGFSYIFVHAFHTGVIGVYYAMTIDWFVRAIIYSMRFFSNKWIKVYMKKQEISSVAVIDKG